MSHKVKYDMLTDISVKIVFIVYQLISFVTSLVFISIMPCDIQQCISEFSR